MKMTSLQATAMAVMVVAAVLLSSGMVAMAEGRALLDIGELIDHLKPDCEPAPDSAAAPAPYSEPSPLAPAPAAYEPSPPYSASPSPVDIAPPPSSPASYQTPPPPREATDLHGRATAKGVSALFFQQQHRR